MLKNKALQPLAIDGAIYDFEKAGDILAVHVHGRANNHITIVARGSISVQGHEDFAGQVHRAGAVIDWPPEKPHGFTALEDATRIVQIMKTETDRASSLLPTPSRQAGAL